MITQSTTFKVPNRQLTVKPGLVVFRHDWRGQDMYWLVPGTYVLHLSLKDEVWTIRIADTYFAGWQRSA